ncbi:hypothetical protein PCASD_13923 [Puccinia coronata f. sp. avenae]|uniref:Uncharacterized protein n=1 Tax=Puccinia coronata f. sp. avenae TaxID=200324 RepID=A0A2N5UHB2_9BASI|nr:hypothetical protein PCASD_13923 [Puccinia coronata f. sp. avenae]
MLNLTADPKNEDPPSSVLSDISESDSESNSSQQTEIPDTKLAEVQNQSDNAASRNPSLPPSSMTSSIDDSEITIITPKAFVQNVQEKSEVLKDIVLDKTLPLSVCNHMKKALEAMEKSIVAIQNGKSLPAQEEVKSLHPINLKLQTLQMVVKIYPSTKEQLNPFKTMFNQIK